jgi:hypothetical protein
MSLLGESSPLSCRRYAREFLRPDVFNTTPLHEGDAGTCKDESCEDMLLYSFWTGLVYLHELITQ